ncbi:hypothetical protein CC86DRAFT_336622 [Ophiobolus disseminans]|uniref:N-acetyltransferase domain-containing protein n=1 Tax=Ophiobolus disseminans TaxID=1469910 RepID=A0A6A6ZCJ1_9PLEO|nr:hypothetical protein CC86DRAFT_336622 [Ophiobolus disseminans]
MSPYKAEFIKVDGIPEGYAQTTPVEPGKRLPDGDVRIEVCGEGDADMIAEGFYTTFPEIFWTRREPVALRPSLEIRKSRLSARLRPTLSIPTIKWIKAVQTSTGEVMGLACWSLPSNPIYNHFMRSATTFYNLRSKIPYTDAEIESHWSHVDPSAWEDDMARLDQERRDVMGSEPHWFLAPLLVWPGFQGRGVGKKLLEWAMEKADAAVPPTPMYLESAITARGVYLHCGFVPTGTVSMVRRGPGVVKEGDGAEGQEGVLQENAEAKP